MSRVEYGDSHDHLVSALVSRNAHLPWLKQDKDALADFRSSAHSSRIVDFGCGVGRHVPQLAGLWNQVLAYDPDQPRLARCREVWGHLSNVTFATSLAGGVCASTHWRGSDVLCSHVLQHVPTLQLHSTLADLVAIVATGGTILLFVSGRAGRSHYFTIDPLGGVATRVPRAEFDHTLKAGGFAAAHLDVNRVGRMLADLGAVPSRAWVHREFHSPLRRGDTLVEAPVQDWCILA